MVAGITTTCGAVGIFLSRCGKFIMGKIDVFSFVIESDRRLMRMGCFWNFPH
jgi:hypothetical protein